MNKNNESKINISQNKIYDLSVEFSRNMNYSKYH